MIALSDLQWALDHAPADSPQVAIIQELIAVRRVADAAMERHEAQDAHDHAAYLRANDLLMRRCDEFRQAQRF